MLYVCMLCLGAITYAICLGSCENAGYPIGLPNLATYWGTLFVQNLKVFTKIKVIEN